jgi:hypothetical protein
MSRRKGENADRPGRVAALEGIIFQNDGRSTVGRWLIHPLEALDRRVAGLRPAADSAGLAMHTGLHVRLEGGREIVAEQLVGSLYLDLTSGLNWTPIERFRERDRGGWDATIPATSFRGVDERAVSDAIDRLNRIEGRPFVGEDCTAFVERAFGGRRLFADGPLLRALGIGVRVGDPALPLLRPEAPLDRRAAQLLHADVLRDLPEALADPASPNARLWLRRIASAAAIGTAVGLLAARR